MPRLLTIVPVLSSCLSALFSLLFTNNVLLVSSEHLCFHLTPPLFSSCSLLSFAIPSNHLLPSPLLSPLQPFPFFCLSSSPISYLWHAFRSPSQSFSYIYNLPPSLPLLLSTVSPLLHSVFPLSCLILLVLLSFHLFSLPFLFPYVCSPPLLLSSLSFTCSQPVSSSLLTSCLTFAPSSPPILPRPPFLFSVVLSSFLLFSSLFLLHLFKLSCLSSSLASSSPQ